MRRSPGWAGVHSRSGVKIDQTLRMISKANCAAQNFTSPLSSWNTAVSGNDKPRESHREVTKGREHLDSSVDKSRGEGQGAEKVRICYRHNSARALNSAGMLLYP